MKKIILLTACVVALISNGYAQGGKVFKGEKGVSSVGVIAGYGVDSKTVLAGLDYRYNITNKVRLAPSAMYAFENQGVSTWYVNTDVHYLSRITNQITMYPIGGLGLSIWEMEKIIPLEPTVLAETGLTEPESETEMRLGLNLGFGAEVRVNKDIILGAEFRYNLTDERIYDQAMFAARIAYYF